MRKVLAAFMTFGVLTLGAQFAQADFLSFSDSFTDELTELTGAPDARLMVDYFDGSLGTLTGVTVTMSASLTSEGFIENQAAGPQSFIVRTRGEDYHGEKVTAPAILPSPYEVFLASTLIAEENYVNLAVGALTPFGPGTASTGPDSIFDSAVDLGDINLFVGTGLFGYDFFTLIETSVIGGGGNVLTQITTIASGELVVLYEFRPDVPPPPGVPEPATMLLLGTGLVGVAGLSRKRKKA